MTKIAGAFPYNDVEKKWLTSWQKGDYFHADVNSTKKPYSIIIPPPNVTSRLHMGHGLNNTIQDILIRWKRMMGYDCLWLPGTDHAGIATQMMVERALQEEGTSRKELGREKFFTRCVEWKEENGSTIIEQQKRLGASCDFKREAYTMSPSLSRAVREIFVRLYNDGLIYRGERLVNWDPKLQTAISDDEIENQEVNSTLWYINYPIEHSSEHITIATTRPETMLGDVAVCVHPEDERYKHLIGKNVVVPIVERAVPIIADTYVKPEFGSGCVKITPAHDYNDFEIGKRHQLPLLEVMHADGSMNEASPSRYQGLDRFVARKKILAELKEKNLLIQEKPYKNTVPHSERSKVVLEPRLSKQWYVKMSGLAQPALEYVRKHEVKFYPEIWEKTYFHWLENIKDWCISRQLWWGHRIPVWTCSDCQKEIVQTEDPQSCPSCQSKNLEQDQDVLDTWFSSWLWPVSPFGWPEKTKELERYFPSEVLVTAPEIIYLWVARMVMLSHYTLGKAPFKAVYFNSTICDKKGRKFSKTLGNGIDPLDMIAKYGADATRFTCMNLAPLGGRVRMEESDFETGSRFVTKLWNAAKFILNHDAYQKDLIDFRSEKLDAASKWILTEWTETVSQMNSFLENYQFTEALDAYYHFVWHKFCDWYLEAVKVSFNEKICEASTLYSVLIYLLEGITRLGSPFIPFVCEEIWSLLPVHPLWQREESLVISAYPDVQTHAMVFSEEASDWKKLMEMVAAIRSVRTQAKVPPKDLLSVSVRCEEELSLRVTPLLSWFKKLSQTSELCFLGKDEHSVGKSLVATGPSFSVYVPVGDYIDLPKEIARLAAEKKRIEGIVSGLKAKLFNENFVANAPKEILQETKDKLKNMEDQAKAIALNLSHLSGE